MAVLARIDSTVRVTTRQSEKAPKASEATTASINRGEATGASWPPKPAADDRVMVGDPCEAAGRITRDAEYVAKAVGNIAAVSPPIRRKR
jgi:hypothetical protein